MTTTGQRLQHKTSIITGSSSGLGRAIALRYSREGSNVVCADITPTARSGVPKETEIETHELIQKDGGRAIFVKCDVGDAGQMEALIEAAVKEFGRVDMYVFPNKTPHLLRGTRLTLSSLVNNAGISLEARWPATCHLTNEDVWDTTMRVNAKSVFLGCKYAIAQMLKQEPHPSGDRGWIINMSSIMGIVASQNHRME